MHEPYGDKCYMKPTISTWWKKMLDGQKFASGTEVQSVVLQWLGQQPASFFALKIQKLRDRWVGTNLIHDFTAVTFSVKLAFFREKRRFPWNPWFSVNFSAFSLIYNNARVLWAAFVRMLLFATCRTLALSSWHDCLESWLSVANIRCSEISSFALAQHLEITSLGPVNFPWICETLSVNFPWNLTHFKNSAVKSCIFFREFGWSLVIREWFV